MLDQLVESKDTAGESKLKLVLLAGIMSVMVLAVTIAIIWSLGDLMRTYLSEGLGGDLELSALVAPVPVQAEEPPPPEIKEDPKPTKVEQNVDTRKELIQNIMESPKVPDKISNEKPDIPPRRLNVDTVLGNTDSNAKVERREGDRAVTQDVGSIGDTDNSKQATKPIEDDSDEVAIATPKPKPTEKPVPKTVSGGVVNSKATNLVKPSYPPAARAVKASGAVNVQVTISESGSVISASAVSGHPLLRAAAEAAARSSKFSPTLLSGQPVKVTGVIVYNFVP